MNDLVGTASTDRRAERLHSYSLSGVRRRTAIHEAGHIVVGQALGIVVLRAMIGKDPGGAFSFGAVRFVPSSKYTKHQLQMFSIAGAVATQCWLWGTIDGHDEVWYDTFAMSPEDWDDAGCKPGKPNKSFRNAVDKVASQLERGTGPLWTPLLRATRSLIVAGRNNDWLYFGPAVAKLAA
jgi:hypothetical protein